MTRTGKIARLPYSIRSCLNQRLRDGESGTSVVVWLNSLPDVRLLLAKLFQGRPISEQNLSEWKQGGYLDWLRHQERLEWFCEWRNQSEEVEEEAGYGSVADWLSAPLGMALARCLEEATSDKLAPAERLGSVLALAKEISLLRRSDHSEQRLRMDQMQREEEREKEQEKELAELKASIRHNEVLCGVLAKFNAEAAAKSAAKQSPEEQVASGEGKTS